MPTNFVFGRVLKTLPGQVSVSGAATDIVTGSRADENIQIVGTPISAATQRNLIAETSSVTLTGSAATLTAAIKTGSVAYPYPPPSWYGPPTWTNAGQKRNGIHTVGDVVTVKMTKAGATSYVVYDYHGSQVAAGPISASATSVPVTAPSGGWKPGWYRFHAYGPNFDANYGNTYCTAQFGFVRPNANFPANADGSVLAGGAQHSDVICKSVLGIGPTRCTIDDVTNLTSAGNNLASAKTLVNLETTWWAPHGDGVRPRPIWCAFAGLTVDQISPAGATGGVYLNITCADGTVDGSTVFVSVGAGSASGNKVTVRHPDAATIVETYDNLKNAAAAEAAINGVSAYIHVHYGSATTSTGATIAPTVIGNAHKNGVVTVVQTLYPLGVTYFEGPLNEPALTSTGYAHWMKLFQSYVKQGNAAAKAIGPSPVQIDNSYLTAFATFLNADGGSYCDGFAVHAYNSSTSGDLNLVRSVLDGFFGLLASKGLAGVPVWQTESTGAQIADHGTYHPRRASGELQDRLIWEQYGVPRERNTPWYDQNQGFWQVPRWVEAINGITPQAIMERVLAEETWEQTHSQRLDFGVWGNRIFLGSVYSGSSGSTVVVMTGSALPSATVTFSVAGASGTLNTCDCFGNTSTVTVSAGHVVLPVSETPTYLSLPAGASVTVTACNDWGGLTLTNHAPAATATLGGRLAPELNDNAWLSNYNAFAAGYPAGGGMRSSAVSVPDSAILTWTSNVTIDRVLIWAGQVWQKAGTLLDFTVDTSTNGGSTWTTQVAVANSGKAASLNAGSGGGASDGCIQETYWDEQAIFDLPFPAAVSCNALRIHATATSYGGQPNEASRAASAAWGATNPNQVMTLQEIAAVQTA